MNQETEVQHFAYTKLQAAIHELGHATAQAVLDIGPQSLKLRQDSKKSGWFGQSMPRVNIDREKCAAELDVSQLAGPVAQVTYQPASLRRFRGLFEGGILRQLEVLKPDGYKPLIALHWGKDFEQTGIHSRYLATKHAPVWLQQQMGVDDAAVLSRAESALFSFYQRTDVERFVRRMARHFARREALSPAWFIRQLRISVRFPALRILKDIQPLRERS